LCIYYYFPPPPGRPPLAYGSRLNEIIENNCDHDITQ
jgi:hypothetical protein